MITALDARMVLPQPTGIGRVTMNLLKELARLDLDNEYLAISLEGSLQGLDGLSNIRHIRAPYQCTSPRTHLHLPRVLVKSGAQLVHFFFYITPFSCPVPSVVTVHDTIYSHFPKLLPSWRRFFYRFHMRCSMEQSRYVICTSESTARDVRKFFPSIPQSKLRVIYNGVEDRFKPIEEGKQVDRSSLGLPERYILYVGNHRGHKNVAGLVSAFAMLKKDVPHILVLPTPSGRGAEITLSAVQKHGLADRIHFHDMPDENLPFIYSMADLFVFPSLYEGFGLPPLEAMACGTPVVTSDRSSLPEVVGDAAIMVDPESHEQIAEAIRRVLTDDDLAEDLQARGKEQAKLFSWQNTAAQTLELYQKTCC